MSLAELAVVTLVPLFFLILSRQPLTNMYVQQLFERTGLYEHGTFHFVAIAAVFFVCILIANAFLLWGNYLILKFSGFLGVDFANDVFKYYLSKDFLYHINNNKSDFLNDIVIEVQRIHGGIIIPLLMLGTKVMVMGLLLGSLLYSDFALTVKLILVIFTIYSIFYVTIRRVLARNGMIASTSSSNRMKCISEAFNLIKETKIYQKESFFARRHNEELYRGMIANAQGAILALIPKYFFETLAFSSVCFFVIGMSKEQMGLELVLSKLSFYALAGYKLLPAAQQVFSSITSIKSNIHALDMVKHKIIEGQKINWKESVTETSVVIPQETIELKNVYFTYNKDGDQIKDLSLKLPVGKRIAFVGSSGSGKTTIANILLGLLKPQRGELVVDGKAISFDHLQDWLKNLSFVPQFISLMDNTIRYNLSFGSSVDVEHLRTIATQANIKNFIDTLPQGFETLVGDDGVKLSGGQKQRLGLARALYFQRPIIILDEATSSLDNINESEVMTNIQNLKNKTVIIIAHRLSSIKDCDVVYFFNQGRVIDHGTFEDLKSRSALFNDLINGQSTL